MKWTISLTRENVEFIVKRHIEEVNKFKVDKNPITGRGGCDMIWGHDLSCVVSGPTERDDD